MKKKNIDPVLVLFEQLLSGNIVAMHRH